MQGNWIKVRPVALMRAWTAPKREGLSSFECIYGRPFLCTNIVTDPEALEFTSYNNSALNFSTGINRTPADDSWPCLWVKQASIWARYWGPDKNIGIWGPIPRAPLVRVLPGYSFFSHSCQSARNWFVGTSHSSKEVAPWPKLSDIFYVFIFYALTLYFSDGPDNLCELTSADSKYPESAIWSSRQCLPVLGSLLCCIPQSV